jgi:hypothetical protein
VVVGAAQAP